METTTIYRVGQDTVQLYAACIGDNNPLHTDPAYADRDDTFADEPIVHGTLIQGWFSAQLNEIGEQLDAEVIIADLFTEFHNPVPVGQPVQVTATIDDDDLDSDMVIVDVGLRAVEAMTDRKPNEYASGSATLMIDQTVQRSE